MGNIYNPKTTQQTRPPMQQPSNKPQIPKPANIINQNLYENQKRVSQGRNVKKDQALNMVNPDAGTGRERDGDGHGEVVFSSEEILAMLHVLAIQKKEFQEIWDKFIRLVGRYLKFSFMFPEAINQQGREILRNGSFFVYWLKILAKNSCINIGMVYKSVRSRYQPSLTHQKQYLQQYLSEQQSSHQTPLKQDPNDPTLKRSALKKFDKKVQFGKNQVIYPTLGQYHGGRIPMTVEDRKQIVRSQQAFLLDYFQINQIYLLEEVSIVGLVKQIDDTYAIIQVKTKTPPLKQATCISIISAQPIKSHTLRTLQEIEKQFENLSFLELEGKPYKDL